MKRAGRFANGIWVLSASIFAALYAVCSQIDQFGAITRSPGGTALRFFMALLVALPAVHVLFRCVLPRGTFRRDKDKKPFCMLLVWGVLFCSYVPMFLIVYPGSFTYDSMTQIAQIASGQYDAFHPLLHTLLIRACLSLYDLLQSMEKCGAVYSLIQMVCVSGMFAYVCAVIARCVSRRAAICAAAFFAPYPSHAAFASN